MQTKKFVSASDAQSLADAKVQKSLTGTLFRHATRWQITSVDWQQSTDDDGTVSCYPAFAVKGLKSDGTLRDKTEHLFLSTLVRQVTDFDGNEVVPDETLGAFNRTCRDIYDDADSDDEALTRICSAYSGKTLIVDRTKSYDARTWDAKNACWSDRKAKRSLPQFKLA